MLIIVDKKNPEKAKVQLKSYGHLLELETVGITYEAISGHPDIFFTKIEDNLVVAPNLPKKFKTALIDHQVKFVTGEKNVGAAYPDTACYNAVAAEDLLIHNTTITDPVIFKVFAPKQIIHVRQGYARCNLIFIAPKKAVTSDLGIFKTLISHHIDVLFFSPKEIILPGFAHGFFGGACGMLNNRLMIAGNLNYHRDGEQLRFFCEKAEIEIVELYNGPLYDGGGIFFIDESLQTISQPAI